jgi:hypothetical protein
MGTYHATRVRSWSNFLPEVIRDFTEAFPQYPTTIDRYDTYKKVAFMSLDRNRGVVYRLWKNEFTCAIGEVFPLEEGEMFDDDYDYLIEGKSYGFTNYSAVWYPTEDRTTTYGVNDTERRSMLLRESLVVLAERLKV